MTSVKFVDDKLLERIAQNELAKAAIADIATKTEEGLPLTNLDLFTRSVTRFVATHPRINGNMLSMVRQLQPTQWGLPIELYCFSADTRWVYYEGLQNEIMAYIVALAPCFELKVYQAPSSYDVKA